MTLQNLIKYYKDCFESDNKGTSFLNIKSSKFSHLHFIENEEVLLTHKHPKIPIEDKVAQKTIKHLELNEKTKQLVYATSFIIGKAKVGSRISTIAAPLFYFDSRIKIEGEYYYLYVDVNSKKINFELINFLTNLFSIKDQEIDTNRISVDKVDISDINGIYHLLKNNQEIDFSSLFEYPKLRSKKEFNNEIKSASKNIFSSISTSVIAIIDQSRDTYGVSIELEEIAESKSFSTPLQKIFSKEKVDINKTKISNPKIPMILSSSQKKLLSSAANNPITFIYGPPGTGKTYTIGAIAIDHFNRGQSVLIASKSDNAVDVVYKKISDQIGFNFGLVRGGRKLKYVTPFRRKIKSLITNVRTVHFILKHLNIEDKDQYKNDYQQKTVQLRKELKTLESNLLYAERQFKREINRELEWGLSLTEEDLTLWKRIKNQIISFKNYLQHPLWKTSHAIFKNDDDYIKKVKLFTKLNYLHNAISSLESNWDQYKLYYSALTESNTTKRIEIINQINFKSIFGTFPIWHVNLNEVKDVLPLKKELFDIVIFDESTQCDIASVIPILQRGKKVVIAGDPNQIRHISFLSNEEQKIKAHKYGITNNSLIDYRNKSFLDITLDSIQSYRQISMLDEHFRSKSDIISFSNQKIYDDELKIMTRQPNEKKSVLLVQTDGKRNKKGVNNKEVTTIISNILKKIEDEKNIDENLATSIGIISPFRDQVEFLSKSIEEQLELEEIKKHQIKIGTAYEFQGDEKDEIHISFCIDNQTHHSAVIHINKPDIFNVTITRARNKQYIYYSFKPCELNSNSFLKEYIESMSKIDLAKNRFNQDVDQFTNEITSLLSKNNISDFWIGFKIAGLFVDILVKIEDNYFALDLIGYPGVFEGAFGIEKYRILKRAGIKTFPIPYSNWKLENEKTIKALESFLFGSV